MGYQEQLAEAKANGFTEDQVADYFRGKVHEATTAGYPPDAIRAKLSGIGVPDDMAYSLAGLEPPPSLGARAAGFARDVARNAAAPLAATLRAPLAASRLPIPGAAPLKAGLEERIGDLATRAGQSGPDSAIARALAAGALTPAAMAAGAIPTTVGEVAVLAAAPAAEQAVKDAAIEAAPVLGRGLGPTLRAIRQRIFGAAPGEPLEVFAEPGATSEPVEPPRPPTPPTPAKQAIQARLGPPPAAAPGLPAPPRPLPLPLKEPIRGEGFILAEPRTRRVYDPRLGELDIQADQPTPAAPLQAIKRALGARQEPAKAPVATPEATAAKAAKDAARAAQARAKAILAEPASLRDPVMVQELAGLRDAGALSDVQMRAITNRLGDRYTAFLEDYGPEHPFTQKAKAALEAYGLRPNAPLPAEPPAPNGPQAASPAPEAAPPRVQPPGPAGTPEPAPTRATLEARFGRPLSQVPFSEVEAAHPGGEALPVYRQAILDDVAKEVVAQKKLVPDDVFAEWLGKDPEGAARYQAFTEAGDEAAHQQELAAGGYSPTPILDLARKFKLSQAKAEASGYMGELENARGARILTNKGGLSVSELAQRAYEEGLLPAYDENALFEAIDHELRTGRPLYAQRGADTGYVPPPAPRPGRAGAIFPKNEEPGRFESKPPGQRSGEQVLDEMSRMKQRPVEQKTLLERGKAAAKEVERTFFDRTAPLKDLDAMVEAKLGRPMLPKERAYIQVGLWPGVKGQMEYYANFRFAPIVAAIQKARLGEDFDNMLLAENFIKTERILLERAGEYEASGDKGLAAEAKELRAKVAENRANPRGFNTEEAERALAAIQARVGPKNWGYMLQQRDQLYRGTRDLLTRLRDLGVVSEAAFRKIESRGLGYVPRHILDEVEEGLHGASAGSLSQKYQQVLKTLKGTTKDAGAALPALFDKWMQMLVAAERQNIYNTIRAFADVPGMENAVQVVRPFAKVPRGMEAFHGFSKGIPETLALPEGIGDLLSHLGRRERTLLSTMLSWTAHGFKSGTTHANLAFIGPHSLRFLKDYAMLAKTGLPSLKPFDVARFGADIMEGAFHTVRQDAVYQEALNSKALYSTFVEAHNPELFIKGMQRKEALRAGFEALTKVIPSIVRAMDNALKVSSYQRGLRMGMSPEEAAFETRRYGGAPDYAIHGSEMPELNQLFSYLNVRAQLSYRNAGAAARDPGRFAFIIASLTTAAVSRYLFNHRNDKVGADYDHLPAFERDRKNIYMAGHDYRAKDGKILPAALTVPRTELEQAVAIGVEGVLDHARRVGGRSLIDTFINTFTSLIPVPIHVDTSRAPLGTSESEKSIMRLKQGLSTTASELNPVLRGLAELLPEAGYDTFRDRPLITPDAMAREPYVQENARTTEAAKAISRALARRTGPAGMLAGGISPIKVEHVAGLVGGGVAQGALEGVDFFRRLAGQLPPANYGSAYEAATHIPGVSRFLEHADPNADLQSMVVNFRNKSDREITTAKYLAVQALNDFQQNKSEKTRVAMKEAMATAAKVGAEHGVDLTTGISKEAFKQVLAKDTSRAYELFSNLSHRDQENLVRELRKTYDGQVQLGRLRQEFTRRREQP